MITREINILQNYLDKKLIKFDNKLILNSHENERFRFSIGEKRQTKTHYEDKRRGHDPQQREPALGAYYHNDHEL